MQPVLDEWVAGALSEQDLLKRTEWDKSWRFDARDYLPLFHFARMNRLPMLALNVERSLSEAVGKQVLGFRQREAEVIRPHLGEFAHGLKATEAQTWPAARGNHDVHPGRRVSYESLHEFAGFGARLHGMEVVKDQHSGCRPELL